MRSRRGCIRVVGVHGLCNVEELHRCQCQGFHAAMLITVTWSRVSFLHVGKMWLFSNGSFDSQQLVLGFLNKIKKFPLIPNYISHLSPKKIYTYKYKKYHLSRWIDIQYLPPVPCDREKAHQTLMDDYFDNDPKYDD